MLASSYGTGVYTGAERSYAVRPRLSNGKAVLWFHGAGGDTMYIDPSIAQAGKLRLVRGLVLRGYTVIAADFGPSSGNHLWGNDSMLSSADAVFSHLSSWGVTNTSKVALWGESMGHFCAANWASRNISKVSCLVGTIPACDAVSCYTVNGNGTTGESVSMDAAYGGTVGVFIDPATLAARDPLTGLVGTLAGVPWRGYYTTDDPVVGSQAVPFAAALTSHGGTATAVSMGTGGHADVPQLTIDLESFVSFFDSANW